MSEPPTGPRPSAATASATGSPTSRSAGINPKDGPVGALRRRHQPPHRPARARSSGAPRCDADEHEEGGLFSKAVLPAAILAKAHMPDLAKVVPAFNVESVEAPRGAVDAARSRRKVEFESIDFNKRFLATVPSEYDPVALRELFSPGFLDWVTTIDHEIDFGINDRQLWFLWRLRRAQRGGAEGGADERRRSCSSGSARRWRSPASTPIRPGPGTPGSSRFPTPVARRSAAARLQHPLPVR